MHKLTAHKLSLTDFAQRHIDYFESYLNHGSYEHAQEKDMQWLLLMLRLLRELA